jgi:type II secretory pathway component PulM
VSLQTRDKRALVGLGAAVVLLLLYLAFSGGSAAPAVVAATGSIPTAEKRLTRVRQLAAGVAGREQVLKQVSAELAAREKGVIQAATAAQAQAQLLDIVRRVAKAQTPPLDFGTVDLGKQISELGDNYGEVQISMPFTCHIEELINFLADLSKQPETLATEDLRIALQDPKQKTLLVRLTVAGVVPKRLVPQKKAVF